MDLLRHFGFLIKDIARLHSLNFDRLAGDFGMTLGQCKVLGYLRRNEGISQKRLAELTDTDPMTLVRMLDRMETAGYVERRPDPSDRRASQLFVLPGAAPVLEAIARVSDAARGQAMAGLSSADREQLLDLLQHVHTNLEALTASAPAADTATTKSRKGDHAPAPVSKP